MDTVDEDCGQFGAAHTGARQSGRPACRHAHLEGHAVIKVMGIGHAGCQAIEHVIREGASGADFIAAHADPLALNRSSAADTLLFGKIQAGPGVSPTTARAAAEAHRADIRALLTGADMVFITAGMGGATGTGAAPVVAEIAREMGVLTVALVTMPFSCEGDERTKSARLGLAELTKHVDSLTVIFHDRLLPMMGGDAGVDRCFKAVAEMLKNAVCCIAETVAYPGLVGIDFEDVRDVMGGMGRAMIGSAAASGDRRARIATEQAIAWQSAEGVALTGAKSMLVNIFATQGSLKMKEVNEVIHTVKALAATDAHIVLGALHDERMGDALRVTLVATGVGCDDSLLT